MARPGGNVTGLSVMNPDLAGKRLELLREIVPGLRGLAILANVGNSGIVPEMGEVQAAARTLVMCTTGCPASRATSTMAANQPLTFYDFGGRA
jgi:ABC-type uncharacterized transport system substrate-binding protein